MTAPRGRDDATIRGAVVLVVAIVIGLALLARSGGGGDEKADDTTTTTEAAGDTTTVPGGSGSTLPALDGSTTTLGTGDTQPPDMVAVIVLNGTPDRIPNIAGEYGDKAETTGYEVLEPTNANTPTDTTTIYAAPGFEADAEAMKGVMGLPDAAIATKPDEPLGAGDELADIVVVLGGDYAG